MSAKVAVICICFNQAEYVISAIQSVFNQTYPCELIVIDNGSSDGSFRRIENFKLENPKLKFQTLYLADNIGNCKAFNRGLTMCKADYIIDLAADDILLPYRVAKGVASMEYSQHVAINFSNAEYIDEFGAVSKTHYPIGEKGKAEILVPEGDVFIEVLKRYFICSPTMMYRIRMLLEIGGYDDQLAYEDFDLQLRLSRKHPFSYTDEVLVQKRILKNSMSSKQYKKGNSQLYFTFLICKKAFKMIQSKSEKQALLRRLLYEGKQAFVNKRFHLLWSFLNLWVKTIYSK